MSGTRALVSGWTVRTGAFREDHLKLCFLWYDEILFETWGDFDERKFIDGLLGGEGSRSLSHAITDVMRPLDSELQDAVTGGWEAEAARGYPRWGDGLDHYTYPEPECSAEYAHNELLAAIASETGVDRFDGHEILLAEGRARVAVDAVTLWEGVNRNVPCVLLAGGDERLAMTASRQFQEPSRKQPDARRLFESEVSSMADVPWKRVVEFKKNGSLKALRDNIRSAVEEGGDLDSAAELLAQSEQLVAESMIEVARPRTGKVAFEAITSNLPGLPINPFGLYHGVRDTLQASSRQKQVGWFYLLRDIRAATGEASN